MVEMSRSHCGSSKNVCSLEWFLEGVNFVLRDGLEGFKCSDPL